MTERRGIIPTYTVLERPSTILELRLEALAKSLDCDGRHDGAFLVREASMTIKGLLSIAADCAP